MKVYLYLFVVVPLLIACEATDAPEQAATLAAPDRTLVRTHVVGNTALTPSMATTRQYTATVVSDRTARPSSKTGGVLARVLISEGDDVRRGQVLARLETTELDAAVARAEAALAKAERDLARVEALYADSVATRAQRDDAATGVTVATQQLAGIRYNRDQTTLIAPIGGRVLRKLANAGETLGPGMPVAVIQGTANRDWRLRVGLSDADWATTQPGDRAEVRFDAYPEERFEAVVSERATAADPGTGTFAVEYRLLKQPRSLAAGLLATVTPLDGTEAGGPSTDTPFYIPLASLGRVNGKRAEVFLARNGAAVGRQVQLGSVRGDRVAVLGGLMAGDSLITTSVAWLRTGEPIEVD